MGVRQLLTSKNIPHIYIAARWYYKLGEPIIEDKLYDACEAWMKENKPDNPYLKRSWEDDRCPSELIEMYELPEYVYEPQSSGIKKHLTNLIYNKSMSIMPAHSYRIIYEWFEANKGIELVLSLKVDGINTKTLINGETLKPEVSSSRGRSTDSLKDYTYAVKKKLPNKLNISDTYISDSYVALYGEGYLTEEGINLYEELYGKRFKNPRSAGLSVLEVPVDDRIYQHLKVMFFSIDDYRSKLSDCLYDLRYLGLDVVPYILVTYEGGTYEEFVKWLDPILQKFDEIATDRNIPSDGVVAEINDRSLFRTMSQTDMYSSGNIAIKVGPWADKSYKGIIKSFVISSERGAKENKSVVIEIEPVTLDNNEVVTYVNGYNLRNIISRGLLPGKEIEFKYVSFSNCVLV